MDAKIEAEEYLLRWTSTGKFFISSLNVLLGLLPAVAQYQLPGDAA